LTGVKLSESQVTQAMRVVLDDLGLTLTSSNLGSCGDDELPYQGPFVERTDLPGIERARNLARHRAGSHGNGRGCWERGAH
jgi:hypothetical protein